MKFVRTEELQREASQIGEDLLKLSYGAIADMSDVDAGEVRRIGRRLHLIETKRLIIDGGATCEAIVAAILESSSELERVVASLPTG